MAYPLRMFEPRGIYFGTVRCAHARHLLRPSPETNDVVGGVLARAARRWAVEVFAFAVQSNHMHLLVRAPRGNLPQFMQFVLSNISRKVGWLVRWRGAFWERRYSAEPVLDDQALIGRLAYILAQGVKDGLVRRCRDWPGLSCLRMLVRGTPRTFRWYGWSKRWRARRSREASDRFHERWSERESLTLTPLPCWSGVHRHQRARRILELVRVIERQAEATHARVLGRRYILAQNPQFRPPHPERSPRPLCHGSRAGLRREFADQYRAFVERFLSASARWRSGQLTAEFPVGAVRPFLWPTAPPPLAA